MPGADTVPILTFLHKMVGLFFFHNMVLQNGTFLSEDLKISMELLQKTNLQKPNLPMVSGFVEESQA